MSPRLAWPAEGLPWVSLARVRPGSDQDIVLPADFDEIDLVQITISETVDFVSDLDVFRNGREGVGGAQHLGAFGHEQFQPDGIHGYHIRSHDQAFVIPDIATTEMVRASPMVLGSQRRQAVRMARIDESQEILLLRHFDDGHRVGPPGVAHVFGQLELDDMETITEPFFGLAIPTHIDGVPAEVLNPRKTWSEGAAYDEQAAKLAAMFVENFKQFEADVSSDVAKAGPSK